MARKRRDDDFEDDDRDETDDDDNPRRGKKEKEDDPNRPRNNAYTGMLAITFVALVAASVLMYLDHEDLLGQTVTAPKFDVPAIGATAPIQTIEKPPTPPADPTPPTGGNPMPMPTPPANP